MAGMLLCCEIEFLGFGRECVNASVMASLINLTFVGYLKLREPSQMEYVEIVIETGCLEL